MYNLKVHSFINNGKDLNATTISSEQMTLLTLYLSYKNRKLAVPDKNNINLLPIHNIVMIKADSNYSIIHTENGCKYLTSKTLKHWQTALAHPFFFRIHKSYIINLQQLEQYNFAENMVTLSSMKIPVSRDKKSKLKAILKAQNVALKINFTK